MMKAVGDGETAAEIALRQPSTMQLRLLETNSNEQENNEVIPTHDEAMVNRMEIKLHEFNKSIRSLVIDENGNDNTIIDILYLKGLTTPVQFRALIAGIDSLQAQVNALKVQQEALALQGKGIQERG
ncbi:MAG: hypothetical protein ABI670_05610 [Chloroflexota bacterium]